MESLHLALAGSPTILLAFITLLGLLIGSFLNVVIYRLPIMLQRRWHRECLELTTQTVSEAEAPFNLLTPASSCPACGHHIRAWENIPLLSYLWQRGKCSQCSASISAQYPLVELVTALLSFIVIWHFGYSWAGLAALFFTWTLVALTVIDLNTQLLPDNLTYPLLWA
ncbi:unnamed protein product, partial [Cyprideis torosa]